MCLLFVLHVSEAAAYIYTIDSSLHGNKKGQNRNKSICPVKSGRQDSYLQPSRFQSGRVTVQKSFKVSLKAQYFSKKKVFSNT
ncbi:hypothetical protein [Flavobacterium aquidurense]|uniref:hypothetical protein n=1 Tax=Flavobacterium aquidurense TaxID=362413 RepID=UPI002855CFE0|nr:hypothetical protein [Flavobacterium aquidurense]MDR7371998.1 hypothetical protein [Flavobacterium aquidurense]